MRTQTFLVALLTLSMAHLHTVGAQSNHSPPSCQLASPVPVAAGFVLAFSQPSGNTDGVMPRWSVHRGVCSGPEVASYQGLGEPVRVLRDGILIVRTLDRIQDANSVVFVRVSPSGTEAILAGMVLTPAQIATSPALEFGRQGVTIRFSRGAQRVRYNVPLPSSH